MFKILNNIVFLLTIILTHKKYLIVSAQSEFSPYDDIFNSISKVFNSLKRIFTLPFKKIIKVQVIPQVIYFDNIINATSYFIPERRVQEVIQQYIPRNVDEGLIRLPDIVKQNGHKMETHTILTKDGYHLSMYRILPSEDGIDTKIALLHHGLFGSSDDWILLGHYALPFLLSKSGYDVWLVNARGNRYSRTNIGVHLDTVAYWNFTWHEIGNIDLADTIDYIKKVTLDAAPINFIGHSMGAAAFLVLLSTQPKYTNVFRCAMFLGPLVFMHSARGTLKILADQLQGKGGALDFLGNKALLGFPSVMIEEYCNGDREMCSNPVLFLASGANAIRNETFKKLVLNNAFGGGSVKTLVHYCQLVNSGQFRMYDYGSAENVRIYGMRSPPAYSLNDVTTPIGIFVATDDKLCSSTDAWTLMATLPNVVFHRAITRKDFGHADFVFGYDAPRLVYHVLLQTIEELSTKRKYYDVIHEFN